MKVILGGLETNLKDLSLREKVYQCMIMRPKNMKNMETLEEYFEKYPIGGLYFPKGPVRDLVEMVPGESITSNEWIDKCKEASKYPLLICADGAFIGEDGMHAVSKEGIAASAHARQRAYEYGRSQGMQMNANDVDWILEPSLDLPLTMEVGGAWSTHLMPMAKKIGINFSTPYLFEDYFYREKTFIQMNTSLTKYSAAAAARAVLGQSEISGRMAIKLGM